MPEPKRQRVRKNGDAQGGTKPSKADANGNDEGSNSSWPRRLAQLKAKEPEAVIPAYETLVTEFPLSGWAWSEYCNYLIAKKQFDLVKEVFPRCLGALSDVRVYESYLSFIVQTNDPREIAGMQTVQQAYEYVLQRTQHDRKSGPLFQRQIQFLENRATSTSWEQQHKMDEMRKVYRKAISLPVANIEQLWRSYNAFENGISRATARKFIDERSGAYMQARSCFRELETLYSAVNFSNLPSERRFDASDKDQLAAWRRIIGFELANPLNIDKDTLKDRVLYTYWSALEACCFFPELWYDAIQWAIANLPDQVENLAKKGLEINKLSFSLCVSLASYYEETGRTDDAVATYRHSITALEESSSQQPGGDQTSLKERQTLLFVELMQCTKRSKGVKEARQISLECRASKACTYQIYTASAAIEYQNKDSAVAAKIYEVAYRKFRNNPRFIQSYLDFLYSTQDMVNARVIFEKALNEIGPQNSREIYDQYLRYEASYADITALRQLEERYRQFYAVDLIELAMRRYQQSYSDPIGQELHLVASVPTLNTSQQLPGSIEKILGKLPTENYDGPIFDIGLLISLVQEVS